MSTPVFKYKLPNVTIIDELYDAYVDGGEYGWYALVTTVAKYAWWNHTEQQWEITTYGEGDIPEPQCQTMPNSEEPVNCYVPEIPEAAEILYNIPVLKYLKDPANTLNELINRYTDGGEYGWYAFIFNNQTFAWWNHRLTTPAWELMTGSGGSAYGGLLTTEQDMDDAIPGKFYAFTLSEEHSQLPAWNGALQVFNADEADGVIQVATVVVSGSVKQYARHGVVGNYSAFEICGLKDYAAKDHKHSYEQAEIPVSPKSGETWLNPLTGKIYTYGFGAWFTNNEESDINPDEDDIDGNADGIYDLDGNTDDDLLDGNLTSTIDADGNTGDEDYDGNN